MTAETDLLPLPVPLPRVLVHVLHEGDMELEAVGNYYTAEQVRACVSSATEALRAEVERLTNFNADTCEGFNRLSVERTALITRAERLAEALRAAEAALADIGDADREPGDDVAWCERRAAQALPTVRAALDQETTNG